MDNKNIANMLADDREIIAIVFHDDATIKPGDNGVEKIECYGEPSHYGLVPWLAVYKYGEVSTRIPAMHVSVCYSAPVTTA